MPADLHEARERMISQEVRYQLSFRPCSNHTATMSRFLDVTVGPDGSFDPIVARNLKDTGFECRPGWIFFIKLVHIQCSKLFKGLECEV